VLSEREFLSKPRPIRSVVFRALGTGDLARRLAGRSDAGQSAASGLGPRYPGDVDLSVRRQALEGVQDRVGRIVSVPDTRAGLSR
jgi:hypothetical protein